MIKPIRTTEDHKAALNRISILWGSEVGTAEGDELEILTTLVGRFESAYFPIASPDPIEAIKFRMDQQGLKPADLVFILGGKSRVSEILGKKRTLTLPMIRRLSKELKIPADLLTPEYKLATKKAEKAKIAAVLKPKKKVISDKEKKAMIAAAKKSIKASAGPKRKAPEKAGAKKAASKKLKSAGSVKASRARA